jgi:hypothetical protein
MFDALRQHGVLAALMLAALGLCSHCAPDHPEGEVRCDQAPPKCPRYLPVCEQRSGDLAPYCYRSVQTESPAETAFSLRAAPAQVVTPAVLPSSREYKLVEQALSRRDAP